jgi:hypothetical protein
LSCPEEGNESAPPHDIKSGCEDLKLSSSIAFAILDDCDGRRRIASCWREDAAR